jgi:hypothetical protein
MKIKIIRFIFLQVILFLTSQAAAINVPKSIKINGKAAAMLLISDFSNSNYHIVSPELDWRDSRLFDNHNYPIPDLILKNTLINGVVRSTPFLVGLDGGYFFSTPGSPGFVPMFSHSTLGAILNLAPFRVSSCEEEFPVASGRFRLADCPNDGKGPRTPNIGWNTMFSPYFPVEPVFRGIGPNDPRSLTGTQYVDADGSTYISRNYRGLIIGVTIRLPDLSSRLVRTFSTTGGRIVINEREFILPAGMYLEHYLRWLVYFASESQRNSMPGTIMESMRKRIGDAILANPEVSFGLASTTGSVASLIDTRTDYITQLALTDYVSNFNSDLGEVPVPKYIWNEIGSEPSSIVDNLYKMGGGLVSNLAGSYIEILNYLGGASSSFHFSSPYSGGAVKDSCTSYAVVAIGNDIHWGDFPNTLMGKWVGDLDGDGTEGGETNRNCSFANRGPGHPLPCWNFAPDAAFWAANIHDFNPSLPARQSVKTFSITLKLNGDFASSFTSKAESVLHEMSLAGGGGPSNHLTSPGDFNGLFTKIMDNILTSQVATSSLTSSGASGKDLVYRPSFSAATWSGNVDVYKIGEGGTLTHLYDVAKKLESRNLISNPRKIFYGVPSEENLKLSYPLRRRASSMSPLNLANSENFRKLLDNYPPGLLAFLGVPTPLQPINTLAEAERYIRFTHGHEIPGFRIRDKDNNGGVADLGDIVNSSPVEVGHVNGSYSRFRGYDEFIKGLRNQPTIFLVGANDGMLHAFNSDTGEEEWAYIPTLAIPALLKLAHPSYNSNLRTPSVDGLISVEDAFVNGKWRTLAMFGLDEGGGTYTILDITDRLNPKFHAEVSETSYILNRPLIHSLSKPTIVVHGGSETSNIPGEFNWSMVVGGSSKDFDRGTHPARLYAMPLSFTGEPEPFTSILLQSRPDYPEGDAPYNGTTTSVLAVQTDNDLNVDRLYIGTSDGGVFRVGVGATYASWQPYLLLQDDKKRPFAVKPKAVLIENPPNSLGNGEPLTDENRYAVGIYLGTGAYDNLNRDPDSRFLGRIYGIFDPVNVIQDDPSKGAKDLTPADLQDQTPKSFSIDFDAIDKVYRVPNGKKGFYIDLETKAPIPNSKGFLNPAGIVSDEPVHLRGLMIFPTFLPDVKSCSFGGESYLTTINVATGGGALLDLFTNNRASYNYGIPDINGDLNRETADLDLGFQEGRLEGVIDAQVTSYDPTREVSYTHDGRLTQDDVRVDRGSSGIIAAVSSLGHRGKTSRPTVISKSGQVLVSTTGGLSKPEIGKPIIDTTSNQPENSPPVVKKEPGKPNSLPINIYNVPLKVETFYEVAR